MFAFLKSSVHLKNVVIVAKDCLLTLVKSRLALGSPGWLVVLLVVCHHAENG